MPSAHFFCTAIRRYQVLSLGEIGTPCCNAVPPCPDVSSRTHVFKIKPERKEETEKGKHNIHLKQDEAYFAFIYGRMILVYLGGVDEHGLVLNSYPCAALGPLPTFSHDPSLHASVDAEFGSDVQLRCDVLP